jgi:prevent-host-death family protein
VISRVLLDAVSGGQPLLLTRRGRPAAVLVDADSWAELEQLASDALVAPVAS